LDNKISTFRKHRTFIYTRISL